VRVNPQASTFR